MMWLLRYWKVGLIVVLAGVTLVAWKARDDALVARGRAEEQLKALTQKETRDSLDEQLAARVVTHDTIVLTKWVTKYDTTRRTLKLTDTIAIKQFVVVADSTIGACRQSVVSLSTSCAKKDTLIANLHAMLAVRASAPPKASTAQRVLWGLGGLALGVVADRAVHH